MSPTRQKIVIIPAWYPHAQNPGNGVFVHEQARCLAERYHVTVLFPDLAEPRVERMVEETMDGVQVWRTTSPPTQHWSRFIPGLRRPTSAEIYYQQFWSALRRAFAEYQRRHGKPDLIHAHVVLPAGWIAWQLGVEQRIPVVLTEHSGPFTFHLATPWQRRLVLDTLQGVDQVLAVSPALANLIQGCFPGVEADVLGNVIRTDFFAPAPTVPNQRFRFLAVGALTPEKGFEHLLQAASILRADAQNDFEVIIGGAGPFHAALDQAIDRWNLRSCCHLLGYLDQDRVRAEMRQCDAFVTPSWGETFGVAVCEAMACGKPVIATRCGGPEFTVAPDCGVLVSVGRPHELADAMAGFVQGAFPFDATSIRQTVVARFGAAAFLDKMDVIYRRLCTRSTMGRVAA